MVAKAIECSEKINEDPEYKELEEQVIGIQNEINRVAPNDVLNLFKELDFLCARQRVRTIEILLINY